MPSTPASADAAALLEVDGLAVEFRTPDGVVRAVNGVSFSVEAGETLAVLGESGSGKSVTAQAVMGLLDSPPAFVTAGAVRYRGRDLLAAGDEERRRVRGRSLAMVFQDPLTALNPVFTVGFQLGEMFRVHQGAGRAEARRRAVGLLERVGIPSARERLSDYPHHFSGGMRQRVMIAMALALGPEVLLADEPTTALDVTVQAQILDLLGDLQAETGMGLVLITHNLGVAAETADRVVVMYAGRVVETGPAAEVLVSPRHPYTLGLLRSVPRGGRSQGRLDPIPGAPPSLAAIPSGCPFHPRCPFATDRCPAELPGLDPLPGAPGRRSACFYAEDLGDAG
jgi:oligopeptide transport system ATP-binding protein